VSANVAITFRPLTQWPPLRVKTPEAERVDAQFKAPGRWANSGTPSQRYLGRTRIPIAQTYNDLDRELWAIDATDVVIQLDFPESSFRRDGSGPRDDRRPYSPAVVLTFKRNGAAHTFACDRFQRWQDNLRGITLGLEGLRRLERYGIVQSGEQYRGWQALPSSTTPALSTEAAAQVISARSGSPASMIQHDRETALRAVRAARWKAHPDAGGNDREFHLVQEAARVLGLHHGVTL
jgi:hypothetical protein